MTQLSYQPSLDPFHSAFRFLRLRPILSTHHVVPLDQARVLDFYLAFPFRIHDIRLKKEHLSFRKVASAYEAAKPYGNQPQDRSLFERMRPIQIAALSALAAKSFISGEEWMRQIVCPTSTPLPSTLAKRIEQLNARDSSLLDVLRSLVTSYEFLGANGLKARSGLLEFRYDSL